MSRSRKFKLTQHRSYQRRLRTRDADNVPVEHTYDLVGKILQANDPTGTYAFAYDNMGRLIGTTTTYSFLTTPFTNSYSYDADSNRTGFTAPDSSTNTYTYDTLNRLTTLANSWAGSFGFSYDALSRRTQMTRPNGINTNYSYDKLSNLLSVLHQAGTSTIDGEAYTVDPAGNRTAKTDDLAGVTSNFTYDKIYELTQAMQGTNTTETYSYDPVGNRLSSLGVASYSYNNSNELTSTSNASYTYDNNGNTLTKTDSTGTTNYSWDFENRLTQVTLPGTGGTATFKYDPFGRRIYKSSSLGTSVYAYDGDRLIEETNSSGTAVARYSQGLNIDEPLAMLRSSATSYYEQDGLGTVTSVSNTSGALAQTYTFDSFGKQTASSGSLTNPFQYAGREFDSETSLYYYRARYYDPATGRFPSEDPIMFAGSDNFYLYSDSDPVDFDDPFGLCPKCGPDGYRDATPEEGKKILQKALSYKGTPYKWGGKTPQGFDCSGFVCYVIQNSENPNFQYSPTGGLPTNSGLRPLGPSEPAQPGDVMLFPSHTGFYDPSPPNPGQNLFSPRGNRNRPNPGVTWGKPSWWPGPPKFLRPRVPCAN